MMTTLLRKDWRVYRTAVVGSAVLSAAPYPVLALAEWLHPSTHYDGDRARAYVDLMGAASGCGLLLTFLMAAVYGGAAFAAERREGSADFLAMLPVSRGRVALSKLAVSLACLALMTAVHLAALAACVTWMRSRGYADAREDFARACLATLLGVMPFGVAWLLSSFTRSTAIAACTAIAVALTSLILVSTWLRDWYHAYRGGDAQWHIFLAADVFAVTVGLLCVAAGTVIYVRRVAP